MPHDLQRIDQPLEGVFHQQARKQVPRHLIVMLVELELLLANVREKHLPICTVERRQARDHFIQNDAKTPPVASESVLALALQDLRREILRCSYEAARLLSVIHSLLREAEVGEHGKTILIN